jgi:imidazolonepropionase-like amidohydrolase
LKTIKFIKRTLGVIAAFGMLFTALFTLGVLWPETFPAPVQTTSPIAIVNVTVVDIQANRLVKGQTILIEGDHIVMVGDTDFIEVPAEAQIIDGTQQYLLPALWDMHTHIYTISPLLDLPLHIAFGVTNVRDMMGCPLKNDPFIACPSDKRRWSEEAVSAKRIGPRIVASASFMANGPVILERMTGLPEFFGTQTPEQARDFVQHFKGNVEAIKIYDHIPRDAYFSLVDHALKVGIDVVGHRPHAISAIEAAKNQKSIEHARFILHESFSGSEALRQVAGTSGWSENRRQMLDEHVPEMAEAIFSAMREAGTWYVPTHLTRWVDAYAEDPVVREDPFLRYLHPLMMWQWLEDLDGTLTDAPTPEARQTYREFYEKGLELTRAAHNAGVRTLVGTDYVVAGAYVHRELEQLVMAGLTPSEALHAATLAPAQYFGLEGKHGTVATGKVADMIILSADPLENITNTQKIESVIFNGNLYDKRAIRQISNHVIKQARSWSVTCKILWRFIRNPVAY